MDEVWQHFIKYYETGDERHFEKFWNKIISYIEYKAKTFGLGDKKDDVVQEVSKQIIKSMDSYDKDRPPQPYVVTVIINAILSYRKEQDRDKRKIDNEAISLNKQAGENCKDGEIGDFIGNDVDIEKHYEDKQDLKRATTLIENELSEMEYEIWQVKIQIYNFQYNQIQRIADQTGYSYKQVDNALQRIDKKINWVKRVMDCESER